MVIASDGLDRTKELAEKHCSEALNSIKHVSDSVYKDALVDLAEVVISRIKWSTVMDSRWVDLPIHKIII